MGLDGGDGPVACGDVVHGIGGGGSLMYPFPGNTAWTQSMERNDDRWSEEVELGFRFRYRDRVFTTCFINNNGNITFGSTEGEYTPANFGGQRWMIAPFWGDVDTRCDSSGLVWHASLDSNGDGAADTFVVTWDHVGYYDRKTDRVSTFQLVLTDGSNPMLDRCRTVSFCYGDMSWTTGDASGGVNGFGGAAAIVGFDWSSDGDGAGVVLARCDAPGSGIGGVDSLDNRRFDLSVAHDPYDLDGSGFIDNGDVALMLLDMGPGDGPADLDGNGMIDYGDVAILLLNTGPACE